MAGSDHPIGRQACREGWDAGNRRRWRRRRGRHAQRGRGLLYGLGLFLILDEAVNAAGLAADPRRYPWQAHARGLVAHLVLGVVTDAALSVLEEPGRLVRRPT
jgi:hypothetical protein